MRTNPEHVEKLDRIADRLLDTILARLENGTLSDSGLATVQRMLKENGWVIEDTALDAVRSKLTSTVDPKRFDTDDDDDDAVIARIA